MSYSCLILRSQKATRIVAFCAMCLTLLVVGLLARPASADSTTSYDTDVRERFSEAVRYFKENQVAEALPMFQALEADTESPNASLYVGHCLVKLGRYVDAYHAFSRTISTIVKRNDNKYDETREAARLQLAALDLRVGKLVIALGEIPPGIQVSIDGEALEPGLIGSQSILEPGSHRVEATATDMETVQRVVEIQPGETKTLALTLRRQGPEGPASTEEKSPRSPPQADTTRSTLKTSGFVAAGVGVAGFATFIIAGLGAKGVHNDLETDCGQQACTDAAHRDDAAQGKTLQVVANTGLAIGALGAIGSGVLLYLGFSESETGPSVSMAPGGGVVSYRGAF